MKNPLTVGGGLLAVVSMFLAFTTIFGKSIKLIDNPNGDAYVWIAFGVIIAVVGLVNKRWLNINIRSHYCCSRVLLSKAVYRN
jgi:hypothetical protein